MQSQAVHMMILLFLFLVLLIIYTCAAYPIAKDGCQADCGGVLIPYPFGIGPKYCYLDDWFQIECRNQSSKTTSSAPHYKLKPVSKQAQLEVLNISIEGTLQVNKPVNFSCNRIGSSEMADLTGSPFVYCQESNRPTAVINVPVELEWKINNSTSSFALFGNYITNSSFDRYNRTGTPYCDNSTALHYTNRSTLSCSCPAGFEGNPYLLQPCQDIDECKNSMCESLFISNDTSCENFVGGFTCHSHKTGVICDSNGIRPGLRCYFTKSRTSRIKAILLGLGAGLGLLLLLISAWLGYRFRKKRKNIKRREMFFKRNGGLLLEQQLSSGEVNVEKIKLFSSKELEKSTDNFNNDRILGQGGQGTVYKGMLVDGRIVAVKKSKIVDESQLSDFINEVVILSQINHRNVVQLLGCCLETEVPVLVYEFIPNGTLSQYIHEQNEEFPLTWEILLRISMEIAGALSYLHASASSPIYHRDIKSTNILLDAKYRVKVADFGTSRSIAIDQTHLTTLVHGTFGYLDPEYFQSSQFTDKSDVYSFGVVLVELLTGQKPISFNRSQEEGKSLATYFIISMQLDRLFEILDTQVVEGGSKADIIVVANLARRCLDLNGRKRPTMREVTAELEVVQNQMAEKTSNGEQKCEEVEYVRTDSIEPWDVVSSSTGTGPVLDGDSASLLHEIPLLSFKSL